MAVYTHLQQSDFATILGDANLGVYQKHEGITEGVENTNYHLWTDMGRYVLTVFEARTDVGSLPFVFAYQTYLRGNEIECPQILYQGIVGDKSFGISSFLEGASLCNVLEKQAYVAGAYLANMHLTVNGFDQKRDNPMGIPMCQELFQKSECYMSDEQSRMVRKILETPNHMNCPIGAIHADYFPGNVFFDVDGNNVTGVIDFYFSCTDYFIYDLAIAMNAWGDPDALIDGYQSVRSLTGHEKIWLPHMRRRAAMRIFLTRLYDWHNTPSGTNIVKHDPVVYWDLLKDIE